MKTSKKKANLNTKGYTKQHKKKEKWERIVEFSSAYDKRHPNSRKNYGICSVLIKFILKKDNKAVQFMLGTDWYLPETVKEYREKGNDMLPAPIILRGKKDCGIDGWDVGYHSPKPMFKGQTSTKCYYIKGKCYYDGSGLYAKENEEILIRKGSEGVWKFLEKDWKERFTKKTNLRGKGYTKRHKKILKKVIKRKIKK